MIPVLNKHFGDVVRAVEDLILTEVNVKEIDYITEDSGVLVKKIKPNFKSLGPKYGKLMKQLAGAISKFDQDDIRKMESEEQFSVQIDKEEIILAIEDVEISTEDIPGWSVASQDHVTVALDMNITPQLAEEGLARELVNRIQNLRKDKGFEVTDRIKLQVEKNEMTDNAFANFNDYISSETLATMKLEDNLNSNDVETIGLIEGIEVRLSLRKE